MADAKSSVLTPEALVAIRFAIFVLFVIYVAPLFAVLWAYLWTQQFLNESPVTSIFIGFVLSENESFALVHKAILPLMGGFAPLAFKDTASSRQTMVLMALLLLSIAVAVLLSAAFSAPAVRQNLSTLSMFGTVDASSAAGEVAKLQKALEADGLARVQSFFNRTQEVLSMYLLMLFGLTMTSSK